MVVLPSLKLTQHRKMDGWNTSFLLGWHMFRGYVSFGHYNHFLRKLKQTYSETILWPYNMDIHILHNQIFA